MNIIASNQFRYPSSTGGLQGCEANPILAILQFSIQGIEGDGSGNRKRAASMSIPVYLWIGSLPSMIKHNQKVPRNM